MIGNLLMVALLTVWPATTERVPAYFSSSAPALTEPAADSVSGPAVTFTVPSGIQVPGKTLSAGTYTIRVLDHLSDRMIVRVDKNGKRQTTFLALPKSSLTKSGTGPIQIGSGSKPAMRGFAFPDGTVAEFVYPKGEAVGLAKANGVTVPAIDPASDGRSESRNMSNDDLQMVTLWLLSPTEVGPGTPSGGIKAAKYQVPQATPSTQVAQVSSPAAQPAPQQVASAQTPPRPVSAAVRPRPRPVLAVLPHTASAMPLVELAGLLSLCGATGLLTRRRLLR